jgi:signal transduction histidine kinase
MQSIRVIGDLNNYTSDFRAAEGTNLLSSGSGEMEANQKEMADLDRLIVLAEDNYERIDHDANELELYRRFETRWTDYKVIFDRVIELSRNNRRDEAIALYRTSSRLAYADASDTLGRLTDRTVASAADAGVRADKSYRQARDLITMAMVWAGLMVVGAVAYIRRQVSNPLLALAVKMHRLADNDMNIPIEGIDRRDEIGEMSRAVVVFRRNAIDLAVSQRGLAQQASMLEEKLAEEQRLVQLQQNFVSMASHEFRTPLTIIDAHAQRLSTMRERITPDELSERTEKIRGAVLRMISLINSLLEWSRVTDGDPRLYFHPTSFDLRATLHDVCHLYREISPQSRVWETFGPRPWVMVGDQKLLYQVFGNLIGNAIKYSPKEGLIKVGIKSAEKFINISVEDHGIGIPASDIDHLFDRYYRGSNVSGVVGTGIGLFFAKTVVDLHAGTIAVTSIEGKGTCFTVSLPVSPPGSDDDDD